MKVVVTWVLCTYPELVLFAATPLIDDTSPFHGPDNNVQAANPNLLQPGTHATHHDNQLSIHSNVEVDKTTVSEPCIESESDSENAASTTAENINKNVLKDLRRFRRKQKGYIDVWWLFDDGGVYLFRNHNQVYICSLLWLGI